MEPGAAKGIGAVREVLLVPAPDGSALRWRAEWLGLATAYLEAGLADLEEVIPVVEGQPPSPGLAGAFGGSRERWTAGVQVAPDKEEIRFSLDLCEPAGGGCRLLSASAPRESPERALSLLLEEAARELSVKPGNEVVAGWKQPLSRDPYAILLVGRSAATWYGWLPEVAEAHFGDRRRDPISRAVSVDPALSLAQWIQGRRALSRVAFCGQRGPDSPAYAARARGPRTGGGRGASVLAMPRSCSSKDAGQEAAKSAFSRAAAAQPWRLIFRADEAAALGSLREGGTAASGWRPGHVAAGSKVGSGGGFAPISRPSRLAGGHGRRSASARAWDLVQVQAPDQLRFVGGRVRALLADGEWEEAARLLEALPEEWDDDVGVIEAQVAIAEGGGPAPPYDQLLARWQLLARMDPEPVRRRMALRIREARYDEALAFARTLEDRGAGEEAARLSISLALAIGDFELAAAMADSLDLDETASRIRARAALTLEPTRVPPELERANEPVEWVVRGAAKLAAGAAAEALFDADTALKAAAWMPEALALRMAALEALGRRGEAERALRALLAADPSWPVDEGGAGRIPQVQARSE